MQRPPAPEDLLELESFCNSVTLLRGEDEWSTVAATNAWLEERTLPSGITEEDLPQLVSAREIVRAHIVDRSDRHALASVNGLIAQHISVPSIEAEGAVRFLPNGDGSLTALLSRVLGALVAARVTGRDARLKACRSGECRWIFYDRSPARMGVWCDMDVCGARHKMATYRART